MSKAKASERVEAVQNLAADIAACRRMNSARFTLNEHCFRQGDSPLELWDFEACQPKMGWKYIGWCPSTSTCIPESSWGEGYPFAVMLENDKGERVWLHAKPNKEINAITAELIYGRR